MSRRMRVTLLALVLVSAGLITLGLTAVVTAQSASSRYVVAFDSALPDSQVAAILSTKAVKSTAVLTWVAGLSGTHRSVQPSTAALLAEARAQSIESFTNGVKMNTPQLEAWIARHPLAEMRADPALQAEARSLLTVRTELETALLAARRGEGLVYAVEVTPQNTAAVDALAGDPRVRAIQSVTDSRGAASLKPASYQPSFREPVVEAMSADELYARMVALVGAK